jgi:tripartite ATP-independent transporter DctM subunit
LLIIYGVLAEVSIGGMFIAGILPGLMLAGGFVAMLIGVTILFPKFVLEDPDKVRDRRLDRNVSPMPFRTLILKLVPIILLVILVLGGLYTGFFTPTEAGGIGAFGALIVALSRRSLDLHTLWQVMKQTGVISVSILLLLIAASFYSRMLAIAGLPNAIAGLVSDSGFGPLGFLFLYAVLILLMGMILDSTSILLIMVPIAAPIAQSLGLDLMHFGIVTVLAVEIGLLTPPFGISVFTVHNTLNDPNVSVEQIFAATMPFIGVMLLVLVIVALVPATVTLFL